MIAWPDTHSLIILAKIHYLPSIDFYKPTSKNIAICYYILCYFVLDIQNT